MFDKIGLMKGRKKFLYGILVFLLVVLGLYFFQKQGPQFNTTQVKELIRSFGILGPLVFMLFNTASIVFAPLTALPLWAASLALYGFWPTLLYIFISFYGGAIANFWIARRWGRPVVSKFVGKKGIKKVDEMTEVVGLQILLIIRLIGGASSDYVAYAAGLTNIEFKPYFIITFFASIPIQALNVYVIHQALSLRYTFLLLAIIGYALSVILPLWVYQRQRKKLKK
jgi:uncharacterized membrane protein YdjX (TVP38/TMEM64 family)